MLSQFTSEGGHPSLMDLAYKFPKDIYPIGRLDHDSEGLLILSNDKALNQRILNPKVKLFKTYLSQVEGDLEVVALEKLEKGLEIKHQGNVHFTASAIANYYKGVIPEERDPPIRFRKNVPTSWLTLAISEGKNRQVRKMTAAVGFPTLRLIRIKIGELSLGNLGIGEVKEVTYSEVKEIFSF